VNTSATTAASTTRSASRIHASALLFELLADDDASGADDATVVVVDVLVVDVDVACAVVVVAFAVVVVAAVTVSVAEMPTLPPPQRTPMLYVPGGVVALIVYVVEKSPVGERVAVGPNPSGENSSADDVSCAASLDGHPSVGTLPAIVTVCPGVAVDGSTVMFAAAAAGAADNNKDPRVRTAIARTRAARTTPS
jgi:hypothetical protein